MGCCSDGFPVVDPTVMSPVPGSGRVEQLAQAVAERVVSIVMDAIDIDALLERIDVDALISRVDVDEVVDRVDVDKLIDRVDVEKIIDRVDVEKIIERVDIDSLMEKTELGTIIARSTTGVASEVLDVIRAQGVGLDDFFARWVNRSCGAVPADLPARAADPGGSDPDRAELVAGSHLMAPVVHQAASRAVRATTPVRSAGWWPSPPTWVPRGGCSPSASPALAFTVQLVTGDRSRWPTTRSSPWSPR